MRLPHIACVRHTILRPQQVPLGGLPGTLFKAMPCNAAGLVSAIQAAHADLKARQGAVLVTGGGRGMEHDAIAAEAANWGIATLGIAKAAQHKCSAIMHKELAADGIYVAEVTVMGGMSSMPQPHVKLNTSTDCMQTHCH